MKFLNKLTLALTSSALILSSNSCSEDKKPDISSSTNTSISKEKPVVKSYKEIMQDEITTYEELGAVLGDITDVKSAQAAIPSLTETGFKFNRIKTDLQNAQPISENALQLLKADFKIERRQVLTVVVNQFRRIKAADIDAYSITTKIMQGIIRLNGLISSN